MSHEQQHSALRAAPGSAAIAPARVSALFACRSATARRSPGVAHICDALDAAFEAAGDSAEPSHCAAFVRAVRAALAQAATDATLLTPEQREGSPGCYRRHLIATDPSGRYAIVALVWQPGQASPVHGHHAWCGYAVLSGILTETLYDWDEPLGCATHARTELRATGTVSYTRAGTSIHRLGNASTEAAVSLHVYGVAGDHVATHVNEIMRVAA
jgi:predicted metal-dependent enzyme (double-stranded beta helix superfamily)